MLANILAAIIGLGSFVFYMAAFFFPEVHRKNDFIWSGVGLFYALVLWVCAGRITGGVLLGQTASVALLTWLGWQTLTLRREKTPSSQQTEVSPELQEKVKGFSVQNLFRPLTHLFNSAKPAPSVQEVEPSEIQEMIATLDDSEIEDVEAAEALLEEASEEDTPVSLVTEDSPEGVEETVAGVEIEESIETEEGTEGVEIEESIETEEGMEDSPAGVEEEAVVSEAWTETLETEPVEDSFEEDLEADRAGLEAVESPAVSGREEREEVDVESILDTDPDLDAIALIEEMPELPPDPSDSDRQSLMLEVLSDLDIPPENPILEAVVEETTEVPPAFQPDAPDFVTEASKPFSELVSEANLTQTEERDDELSTHQDEDLEK